jgi:hypothetical protein
MYYQIVEINPAPVVITAGGAHKIAECDALTPVQGDFRTYAEAELALTAYNREDTLFTVYAIVCTAFSFPIQPLTLKEINS